MLRKKILYFASSKGIGITESLAHAVIHINKLNKCEIEVLSGGQEQFPGLKEELNKKNIAHHIIPGIDEKENIFGCVKSFLKLVRKNKYDIIYAQTNTHLIYSSIAKLFISKHFDLFYTVHYYFGDKWYSKIYLTLLSKLLRLFNVRVIVGCNESKNSVSRYGIKGEVAHLGHNYLVQDSPKNKVYSYEFSNHSVKIVYIAYFRKSKNHIWLIEALKDLIKDKEIFLYFVGNGDEFKNCKEYVNKLGLSDKTILLGELNRGEIDHLLNNMDIAVVPSLSETYGLTIVEPMFYGIPVVANTVGVAPDIIENGVNGYVISVLSPDKWKETISLLYNDPALRKEIGQNSKKYALQNLTWDAYAENLASIMNI
jgi:glycosyltransferase involved in cell wall biosynthesis